jgi:hypothetical protein
MINNTTYSVRVSLLTMPSGSVNSKKLLMGGVNPYITLIIYPVRLFSAAALFISSTSRPRIFTPGLSATVRIQHIDSTAERATRTLVPVSRTTVRTIRTILRGSRTILRAARTIARNSRTVLPEARTILRVVRTIVPVSRTIARAARTILPDARTVVRAGRSGGLPLESNYLTC